MRIALAVVLAVASGVAAGADVIHLKRHADKKNREGTVTVVFKGVKDAKVVWGSQFESVPQGGGGGFSPYAFGRGEAPKPIMLDNVSSVDFDGEKDWLSVTLKSGEFVRGEAESLKGGVLRLKGVEKPIRLLSVKEIVATEPPAPEPAE